LTFTLSKPAREGGVNAVHHLVEFILAGDGVELAGVEAIDADVNRRQPGIAPAFDIARQAVTVGGDRNLTDRRVFARAAAMISVKSRRRRVPHR
jgi:hypothetical protein